MKKALRETQTLCAGCCKLEPKIFAPPQTPFLRARDCQNLISWRWSLPLPTNPVWWGSMHAISSYRGNRPTNTVTNPQTGPTTIHCTAASAQCNEQKDRLPTTIISSRKTDPGSHLQVFCAHGTAPHQPVSAAVCPSPTKCYRSVYTISWDSCDRGWETFGWRRVDAVWLRCRLASVVSFHQHHRWHADTRPQTTHKVTNTSNSYNTVRLFLVKLCV